MRKKIGDVYRTIALFLLRLTYLLWSKILLFGLWLKKIDPKTSLYNTQVAEYSTILARSGGGSLVGPVGAESVKLEPNSPQDDERINKAKKTLYRIAKESRVWDRKEKRFKPTRLSIDVEITNDKESK